MDGYQECYHCTIAHPGAFYLPLNRLSPMTNILPLLGFAKSLSLDTYTVTPKTNFARHTAENNSKPTAVLPKGATSQDAPPTFTFVFPSNGVTVTDVMWYMCVMILVFANLIVS